METIPFFHKLPRELMSTFKTPMHVRPQVDAVSTPILNDHYLTTTPTTGILRKTRHPRPPLQAYQERPSGNDYPTSKERPSRP